MASIADVLTYLVSQAPGLSEENRAEYLAAVGADLIPASMADPQSLAGLPEPGEAPAEVAALQARLAELQAPDTAG